jgi:hypothetical protein
MKKFADDIDTVFYFTYRFEIRSGTKRSWLFFQAEARAQIDADASFVFPVDPPGGRH